MISGKNPNYEQKKILKKAKKEWNEWLVIKNNRDSYIFRHKNSNETIELPK